ncbi:ATP-binding cassette domain-containing protein [Agrobacterium sp. SHOUNA12C]|uniref:Urea or short-chain amide ABC transporter n=2 Tax=Rhizobium rhizogenes TaxID=359 RepID=B9JI66_RHIR8|nr:MULTISPECIES: ATP-binding cassette domain-containing protein [Rhizobium]ACM29608.1 urea or short-chain amide ABC transporter [Rhizobium rhizogenes K84]KAA6487625.1 ABC transporter ATP-binding protein [Agrobacterium sp. ICMP 7243]MCJ9722975.1 ATP-binding cassette domain-containing protein [Agrobacterium sp. BETTINA12B]MCJ9758095.1 ATP-binding cassette domain-containing protein [Agrobacterium sp. SHOUNA12C]OCI96303.1 ABC transporter ATP-binding protein [Agrobacterium sp. 13-626]OCJ09989.1 AB
MTQLLSVKDLRSGYGRIPILAGVDMAMEEGEYLGILGHNGMGKTTLMRTLMGHLPATAGSVEFSGRNVTGMKPFERSRLGMGLVPQGREIFPELSVYENLRMGLVAARKEDRSIIDTVLQDFPRLVRLLDRRGGALSGGEQQLLALARCLCTKPRLILLDEPTEGIQPSIIEEIIETLIALKSRWKLSLIVVEQNLEFITSLSDRILHIQKGRITGEIDRDAILSGEVGMAPV